MVKQALRKTLRKGAREVYFPNDPAQVWGDKAHFWENGYRLIFESGRNAILEKGQQIVKIPLPWVRKKLPAAELEDEPLVIPKCGELVDIESSDDNPKESTPIDPSNRKIDPIPESSHEPSSSSKDVRTAPQPPYVGEVSLEINAQIFVGRGRLFKIGINIVRRGKF